MIKNKILLVLLALSLSILTVFVSTTEGSSKIIHGFPFYFVQHFDGNLFQEFIFKPVKFLVNFTFWILLVWSFSNLFIKQTFNRWKPIVLVIIFGSLFFYTSLKSPSSCVSGFPMFLYSICKDVEYHLNVFKLIFYTLINIIFWLSISVIFINICYRIFNRHVSKWKFLLDPLFLVFISIFTYQQCGGFICLFPSGWGVPIAFYNKEKVYYFLLLIDYVFFFISYLVFTIPAEFLNRKHFFNINFYFDYLLRLFDTQTRPGRQKFVASLYVGYILLFYTVYPIVVFMLFQHSDFLNTFFIFLVFIIPIILSYKIPKILKNTGYFKYMYLYNTIFVLLLPFFYAFF